MKLLKIRSVGLSFSLQKGLTLGSGLGSSAAAGAAAVNALFGGLSHLHLVHAGLESESKNSSYHADNIAPAIMGGFVLIRSYQPLDLMKLEFPETSEKMLKEMRVIDWEWMAGIGPNGMGRRRGRRRWRTREARRYKKKKEG